MTLPVSSQYIEEDIGIAPSNSSTTIYCGSIVFMYSLEENRWYGRLPIPVGGLLHLWNLPTGQTGTFLDALSAPNAKSHPLWPSKGALNGEILHFQPLLSFKKQSKSKRSENFTNYFLVMRKKKANEGLVKLAIEGGCDIVPSVCFCEEWSHRKTVFRY